MSEHEAETLFLRHSIRSDDSEDRRKLEKSIAQAQRDERCVKRFASVLALFPLVAIAGAACGATLQKGFPYDGSYPGIRVLCEIGLASLICLVAFAGLLMGYRKKLKRLRAECRRLATRLLESYPGKPDIATLPGNSRGSDDHEAFQGAAEVSGYHGSLDSPSWRSNRVCG
jgi:hypothetical protein